MVMFENKKVEYFLHLMIALKIEVHGIHRKILYNTLF